MEHIDKIKDTETHFLINPETRAITNESAPNNTIVQHDHNSERFTFEIPRYVDGHDMAECSEVRVHYRNSTSTNLVKTNGLYVCDDLAISPENEDTMTFSWLLSSDATQYIGSLHFSVQFLCLEGERIVYAWNTGIYKDIEIIESINNSEQVIADNVDAITALKNDIVVEIEDDIEEILNTILVSQETIISIQNSLMGGDGE